MDYVEVLELGRAARGRGLDPVERLHGLGLILTDERRNGLVRDVALSLADQIENVPVHTFLKKNQGTSQADLHRGIVEFIRNLYTERLF